MVAAMAVATGGGVKGGATVVGAMAVVMVEVVKGKTMEEVARVEETVAAAKGEAREVAAMAVATMEGVRDTERVRGGSLSRYP